jgi:hypothetical protein
LVHRGFHRAWTVNGFRDRIMGWLGAHLQKDHLQPGSGQRRPMQVVVTG